MKALALLLFSVLATGCSTPPRDDANWIINLLNMGGDGASPQSTERRSERPDTCVAIKPLAEGLDGAQRLWGRNSDFWPQGATLRVKFLDGSKSQQNRAWFRFQKIDPLINLRFVRVTDGPSECRVSFNPNNGHWSYVGKYNARLPQSQATMNLALESGIFGDPSREWDRTVLHEVLHFAGFQHEHQHPQGTTPWNVPVVMSDYRRTQGWSDAQIRYQVLNRSDATDFNGSAEDRESIMQYPIPKEHVLDPKYAVGWNRKLTETDKATLKRIYP